MSSVAAISAFLPSITSGTIFAPRRANKGTEADNPFVAAMNFGIAGGQVGNIFRGAASIAKASTGDLATRIVKLEKAINTVSNELSRTDKIMNGVIRGGSCVMRNINPAIGATELVKTLFAEDKVDAALTGGCAFGGMLLGERAAKEFLGLAKTSYKKGAYEITPREALYKKMPGYPYLKEQLKAIKDYLITKRFVNEKVLKHTPFIIKGISFALASILSYQAGHNAGKFLSENFGDSIRDFFGIKKPEKKA